MTWSATEVVDLVFVPIYFLLVPFILYNLIKHTRKTRGAYVILLIFALLRTVSNALLVAAYEKEKVALPNVTLITNLFVAGFIMQSIGYSFLIGVALRFYSRATSTEGNEQHLRVAPAQIKRKGLLRNPSGLANIINIVAIILLAVGLSNSSSAYSSTPGGTVSSTAKAGAYLYCFLTALIMVMCFYQLFKRIDKLGETSKTILIYVLIASVPMAMRSGYSAYRLQSNSLVRYNTWVHMVFQYIVEVVAVIIFNVLGYVLLRTSNVQSDMQRAASDHTVLDTDTQVGQEGTYEK